ncbi:RNA polymerase sigma factor [Nocardioides hankookensis]|uniref:RNA polymerase sigma factor n=1 Tax=Nocardioides hankookensis TaxID=443157 RepID=A0ABW1LN75_9ACTN
MARVEGDELVARARTGDESAWAELYGDHAERLVVWLRHVHRPDGSADAEDIAAEAWLTAARRLADFEGDRHDFAGWLFGIARNVARHSHRASRTRRTTPLGPEQLEFAGTRADVGDPAAQVAGDDLARSLVSTLPEREAQVVACLDVVGLDVATTSRALGISATAVRVAHHRGLRRLRQRLAADVTLRGADGM